MTARHWSRLRGWPTNRSYLLVAILWLLMCSSTAFSHAVNVHEKLTLEGARRSERMWTELQALGIANEVLVPSSNWADKKIKDEMKEPEAAVVTDFGAKAKGTPFDLIRLGSILEDKWARFCNHFYTPVSRSSGKELWSTGLPPCLGEENFDAKTWVMRADRANERDWKDARKEYFKGLTAKSCDDRKKHLREAFITLGHVAHMVEDMASPAHTRNDAHPCIKGADCDYFEEHYKANSGEVLSIAQRELGDASYSDASPPGAAITRLANYTAAYYYSESTIGDETCCFPLAGDVIKRASYNGHSLDVIVNSEDRPIAWSRMVPPKGTSYPIDMSTFKALKRFQYFKNASTRHPLVLESLGEDLFPVAIKMAAKVFNYFFRIHLEAYVASDECRDHKVVIKLHNGSSSSGAPRQSCDLKGVNKDNLHVFRKHSGSTDLIRVESNRYSISASSLPARKSLAITIDVSGESDKPSQYLIAYKGPTGNKDEAVAACYVSSPYEMLIANTEAADLDDDDTDLIKTAHSNGITRDYSEIGTKSRDDLSSSDERCSQTITLKTECWGRGTFLGTSVIIAQPPPVVGTGVGYGSDRPAGAGYGLDEATGVGFGNPDFMEGSSNGTYVPPPPPPPTQCATPKFAGCFGVRVRKGQTLHIRTEAFGVEGDISIAAPFAGGPRVVELDGQGHLRYSYTDLTGMLNNLWSKSPGGNQQLSIVSIDKDGQPVGAVSHGNSPIVCKPDISANPFSLDGIGQTMSQLPGTGAERQELENMVLPALSKAQEVYDQTVAPQMVCDMVSMNKDEVVAMIAISGKVKGAGSTDTRVDGILAWEILVSGDGNQTTQGMRTNLSDMVASARQTHGQSVAKSLEAAPNSSAYIGNKPASAGSDSRSGTRYWEDSVSSPYQSPASPYQKANPYQKGGGD